MTKKMPDSCMAFKKPYDAWSSYSEAAYLVCSTSSATSPAACEAQWRWESFGWALFFLRGVAPPSISTRYIYVGVIPFIGLQVVTVALVFFYPQLALWLPKKIGW